VPVPGLWFRVDFAVSISYLFTGESLLWGTWLALKILAHLTSFRSVENQVYRPS
jgi:hypothetical protein